MSSQIDFKTLPANVPVMCIPRVYPNISESRIRRIFDDLDMGTIDRIDMVSKQNEKGEKFNRVFIHFQRWNDTENGRISRERLLIGKEIKIIYDDPWFWKISAYMKPEHKPNSYQPKPQQQRAKPTIQFDSDDEDPKPRPQERYQERPQYQERPRQEQYNQYNERPRPQEQYNQYNERPQYQERPRPQYDERPRPQEQYRDERPRPQEQYKERPRPQKQYKEKPRPKSMVDIDLPTEEQEKHAVNYNVDPKKPPVKKMRKQNLNSETKSKPLRIEDLNTEDKPMTIEDLNTEDNSKGEVEDGEV